MTHFLLTTEPDGFVSMVEIQCWVCYTGHAWFLI